MAGGARQHVEKLDVAGRALAQFVRLLQFARQRLGEGRDVGRVQRRFGTGHEGLPSFMRQPR